MPGALWNPEREEAKAKALAAEFLSILRPPPDITLSGWAEKHRRVPAEEAMSSGPWRNEMVPYGAEIMDAISDSGVRKVVAITGTQMAKTNFLLNTIGYFAHHDPCPMLLVEPNIDAAESFSSMRLETMIRDTPELAEKFALGTRGTLKEKSFPGGYIVMTGANSAAQLKMRPMRVVMFDEVDEAPEDLDGQGDPVMLAVARTNFWANRKIILTSTPGIKGKSRIEAAYTDSSQGRWCHACIECGAWSQFNWKRLEFETLKMECPHCKAKTTRREWLIGGGMWIHENPLHEVRGFHVNALDSQREWIELVEEFIAAEKAAKRGNFSLLKTFINTQLAESWEIRGEKAEFHALEKRREVYHAELPDGVCVITMGIDTQDSYLAYEVVGWGKNFESWGLEYGELWGDPKQGEVFNMLDRIFEKTWSYANGRRLKIKCAAIDTLGHRTFQVLGFCKAREARGLFPIMGQGGDKKKVPLVRPSKSYSENRTFMVGSDFVKSDILSWLKVEEQGKFYCHFPKAADDLPVSGYDKRFFEMLTSEKRVPSRDKRGQITHEWHVTPGVRNEAFDCRCYARVALNIMWKKDESILAKLAKEALWSAEHAVKFADGSGAYVAPRPSKKIKKKPNRNAQAQGFGIGF